MAYLVICTVDPAGFGADRSALYGADYLDDESRTFATRDEALEFRDQCAEEFARYPESDQPTFRVVEVAS